MKHQQHDQTASADVVAVRSGSGSRSKIKSQLLSFTISACVLCQHETFLYVKEIHFNIRLSSKYLNKELRIKLAGLTASQGDSQRNWFMAASTWLLNVASLWQRVFYKNTLGTSTRLLLRIQKKLYIYSYKMTTWKGLSYYIFCQHVIPPGALLNCSCW